MINGQTKLVVGAHIGVPLVAYDLVTDGEGAVVLVDPPLSGTMDPDDVMELWLENELAALDSKTIVDPNVSTTLRIPKGRLHPDRINKLFYTVRRGSDNRGTSTPLLETLYNRIRPGLKDRLTDPGGHSELKLLLPDEIKNGVGPDFVSAEVCVAYPYCRAYDLITLKCNGELLDPKPKVNPNQAPQPPNPGDEPPITICFTITRAYLDKAKRLDKKLHFSYTVTDQIGNGPDTDTPWSPVQSVDEDLDGTRLPMPILLERKEDFPGDDASIIDLEKLAGNPLLVVVLTTDNRFVVGYDVIATYTATNTGQPADVVVTVPGKVEADPFGVKQTLFLEVPNDKVFAGSDVTVTYELRKPNGDLAGNSQVAHARVTGVRLDLKPPSIKEAPNGTSLDPFAGKDTLTAVVDYVGMLLNDEIIVTFSGAPGTPDGGSHITDPWTVRTLGPQDIPLDNTVIAFNLGQSVTVSYTVARGSDDPKDSKTRTLEVLPIKNEDNRLPDPVINGITSAELDVTTLPGQPRTRIAAWLLLALKQTLWLRYFVEGNPTPISTTYNGALIPPDGVPGGMQPYTPMAELNKLADGAKLRIEFKVGFDGSTDESKAVVFPSRVYTVKAFATPLQPSLKEAAGSNSLNPFAAKDTLTVVVPHYTGMASTDQISVTWTGAAGTPAGGSHTSTAVEVGTVGEKEIPIPNTVVAFNLGKAVTVFYTVIRNGTPTKSEEFILNVQTIPNEDSRLPNPIINANTTSELDVTTLPANAQTRIAAWTLIKQGQKLWMRYFVEGNPTPISTTYNGDSVPAGAESSGMYPNTPVNELKALANGARLRIEFKVGFDGSTDESKAVVFPTRIYTVKALVELKPEIISVKDPNGKEIENEKTTTSTVVTLTGTASIDQDVEIFDGIISKGTATATGGTWTHSVTGLALGYRSLTVKALYGGGQISSARTFTVTEVVLSENFGETYHKFKLDIPYELPSGSIKMTGSSVAYATIEQHISYESPGQMEDSVLFVSSQPSTNMYYEFKSTYSNITFWFSLIGRNWTGNGYNIYKLGVYDAHGTELDSTTKTQVEGMSREQISFSKPGIKILRIEVFRSNSYATGAFLDFFKFKL
jgi:hypothetical protein